MIGGTEKPKNMKNAQRNTTNFAINAFFAANEKALGISYVIILKKPKISQINW